MSEKRLLDGKVERKKGKTFFDLATMMSVPRKFKINSSSTSAGRYTNTVWERTTSDIK